jgi:ribosomal subunit interface protein
MGQVQVTFRDFTPSLSVTQHVERRTTKLDTFFDRMIKCHVVVEAPHRHSKHGLRFHVRVDMFVPGKELVVSRDHEDAHAAIDSAFGDAERVLEDYSHGLRDRPREHHSKNPTGVVARVFPDRGYGFIRTLDGGEVYFHQNSVLGERFHRLTPGARVRYVEEDGDKGPQASTVEVVGH